MKYIRVTQFDTSKDTADIVANVNGQWVAVAKTNTASAEFEIHGVTDYLPKDMPDSITYASGRRRFVSRKCIANNTKCLTYRVVAEILHHSDTVSVEYISGHGVDKHE